MMAASRLSSSSHLLMLKYRCNYNRVCLTYLSQSISSGPGASSSLYSIITSPYEKLRSSLCSFNSSYCSHFSTTVETGEKQTNTHRTFSRQYNPTNAQKNTSRIHHNYINHRKNNHKQHRSTPFHSVRLINESAARETTQLFTKLHKESFQTNITYNQTPWRNRASLLAAEQALEFWAHRNNNQQRNNRQQNNRNDQSGQFERDAQTALELFTSLHHFHTQEVKLSNGVSVLTNGMYSHVIDALSKSPNMQHVREADRLLRQFISLYVVENSTSTDKKDSVQSMLHELGLPCHAYSDGDDQQTILQMPSSISWNYKDKHHFPNQIRITGVMRGQVRQKLPVEAESLLHLKIKLASSSQRNPFQPNEIGYATVIDGYSRICDGENAERILQLMKGRLGGDTTNGANVVAYNAAISAWARSASRAEGNISKSRSAAEKAEQLLREMWSLQRERNNDRITNQILPDVVSYSSVISAYASCLDRSFGLNRAEELLSELEGLAEKEFNESTHDLNQQQQNQPSKSRGGGRHLDGFQLNSTVYNALLQAYANAGVTSSAEDLLDRMISLHSRSLKEGGGGPFKNVRPNTRTFNVVLNTWAKRGTREAGAKANELLLKMEEMSAVYRDRISQPDIISYNTVLSAWSKSAGYGGQAPSDTKEIVGEEAAYKALELLDRIEGQSYRIKPDRISYSTTIAAFANAAQTCESGILMAQKADALISRMRDRMGVEPDDYSFNGVLLAWSRTSGGMSSARHCESILRSMRNPTNVSWSTVINAYTHAGGALEAAGLLKEMEDRARDSARHQSSNHAANTLSIVVYNNVIHAWSRNADPDASKYAEAILKRLESGSSTLNLPKPDVVSYRLVLNAIEYSKDPDKAERAKSVLDRFIASIPTVSDPNTINTQLKDNMQGAYNSVLAACAYTPSNAGDQARNNAARILVETLRDLNNSKDVTLGPNQESFSIFMQGCTHLFRPGSSDRALLMKSALQECCENGFLTEKIWDKFCNASSEEDVQSFLSGIEKGDGSFAALPCDWSRNVAP
mmetsp:Transcript_2393/g.5266  ORF Transcript_2393/g.5266 Transcript_2393/m.5266 type:complete len:1033 (-) Transcript_2393:82-3180(-)